MLNRRRRQQPLLLEGYWTRLLRQRQATPPVAPPDGLDQEVVDTAVHLANVAQRLRPTAPFVTALRRRLEVEAQTMPVTGTRAWTSPAIEPTRARPAWTRPAEDAEERQIMSDLSQAQPQPAAFPRRRWVREAGKLVAAAVVFIIIGAVLVLVLNRDDEPQPAINVPAPTATASPAATAVPTNPSAVPTVAPTQAVIATPSPAATQTPSIPRGEITTTIPVGDGPFGITTGAGAVWVPNIGDGTLSRINPATNEVEATIDIGAMPSDYQSVPSMPMVVAASDTAVWVTRYNSSDTTNIVRDLLRIDPATNTIVATIPLDVTPHFMAFGEGALWLLSRESDAVLRIDTDTNQVVATIEVSQPLFIAVGEGSVWVPNGPSTSTSGPVTRTVTEIDPRTNAITGTFSIDQNTIYIAAGAGAVWIDNGIDNEVLRVDPETYEVTARIPVILGAVLTVGDGFVWGHNGQLRTITQIDPETNAIVATYPSGGLGGPIAVADGVVWIADSTQDQVIRIDP